MDKLFTKGLLKADGVEVFTPIEYVKSGTHLRATNRFYLTVSYDANAGATKEEAEALALLFAKAPAMYGALKAIADMPTGEAGDAYEMREVAEAALASLTPSNEKR